MEKIAIILISVICMTSFCFAGEVSVNGTNEVEVPIQMTKDAQQFDFSITERIKLTGKSENTSLSGTSVTLKNNVNVGKISYDLNAKGSGDWELVSDTTSFALMDRNTHKFGLKADGTHDMTSTYEDVALIAPSKSNTTTFSGHSALQEKSYNGEIGVVVADIFWEK